MPDEPLFISFDQFISITSNGQDLHRLVAIQIVAQSVYINVHGFTIEHIITAPIAPPKAPAGQQQLI